MRKLLMALPIFLSGCAQPVFDPAGVSLGLTPRDASHAPEAALGRRVIWGGEIVDSRNLAHSTELIALAMPLTASQKPSSRGEPLGRFIARRAGYLETMVFAPGRRVTVIGVVDDVVTRPVGESQYTYPVVEAEAVHLWPEEPERSNVRFGFGIGIHGDL